MVSWARAVAKLTRGKVAAAVCWRWEAGEPAFALVTTRDGERWTFPKGHREPGETAAAAAAREAGEEAGVAGIVDRRRLTTYRYPARRGGDLRVSAFLLEVTEVGPPDDTFRELVWCDLDGAGRRLAVGRDPVHAAELERVLRAATGALSRRR